MKFVTERALSMNLISQHLMIMIMFVLAVPMENLTGNPCLVLATQNMIR